MKDGSIITLQNTGATSVFKSLTQRYNTEGIFRSFLSLRQREDRTTDKSLQENFLTVYLNPGHGFLRLDCNSCAEGNSYNQSFGFYPRSHTINSGSIRDESIFGESQSNKFQLLKIRFSINADQAKAVYDKKNSIEDSPQTYHMLTRNCIHVAEEIASVIDPRPFDFFTHNQLEHELGFNSLAITHVQLEHQVGIPSIFTYSVAEIAGTVIVIKVATIVYQLIKKTASYPYNSIFRKNAPTSHNAKDETTSSTNTKSPEYIRLGLLKIATATIIGAAADITGNRNRLGDLNHLIDFAIPVIFFINQIRTAEPLVKYRRPSPFNRRISLFVSGTLSYSTSKLKMQSELREKNIGLTTLFLLSLTVLNEAVKAYHDLTAPPDLDGADLT